MVMNEGSETGSLRRLYEGSADDVQFGIGSLVLSEGVSVPCIVVHHASWALELLQVLGKYFGGGLLLRIEPNGDQTAGVFLATRSQVVLEAMRPGELHALRAPAWDARLSNVAFEVIDEFEHQRAANGFMLVLQSVEWELVIGVMPDGSCPGTLLRPRQLPMPPEADPSNTP